MIWADRVGIVWALIVQGVLIYVNDPNPSWSIVFWVSAIPWLLMRALDWIFTSEFRHTVR